MNRYFKLNHCSVLRLILIAIAATVVVNLCLLDFQQPSNAVNDVNRTKEHVIDQLNTPIRSTNNNTQTGYKLRDVLNYFKTVRRRNYNRGGNVKEKRGLNRTRRGFCILKHKANFSDILQDHPIIVEENRFKNSYDPLPTYKELPFLSRFKNPCFMQRLSTSNPYKDVLLDNRLHQRQKNCAQRLYKTRIKNGENLRLRCFPAFFIAGVQKCGTSELNSLIPLHKSITSFTIKENHWWNRGRFRARKGMHRISLEGYLDLFDMPAEKIASDDGGNTITGDVSPALLWDQGFWKEIPENKGLTEPKLLAPHFIKQVLPEAKFIVILRNPADRLYSDWLYFLQNNNDTWKKTVDMFHETVKNAIQWFDNCQFMRPVRSCFYDPLHESPYEADKNREKNPWWHPVVRLRMGMYYIFLNDLLHVFDRSQLLVIRLEDFSWSRAQSLQNIYHFLNLPRSPDIDRTMPYRRVRNSNSKGYQKIGHMLPQTRDMLEKFYGPYNEALAKLLNDSKFKW